MSNAIVLTKTFAKSKTGYDLPEKFENINSHNLYLYVKSYLSSLRANTALVKNRSAVRGGGKKPKAQKGSGAARWGTLRSPLFVGGGQIFGPTKRNYIQKINKKQKVLALHFSLNSQAKNDKLFVTDKVSVESGKTKDAMKIFTKIGQRDLLIVVESFDEKTYLAFRNIKNCYVIERSEINAYLVAAFRSVLIEKASLDALV
ncbi:LSU ribosomal protein L4p (L1e) [hydrothermal vent metagenome]|uniref:LSU ribosomal protein L4p (L1e) n=1 Tax=hydrothermal vent metagenome TaxID=652676 RepID=A0A3B1DSE5_9ZZZZ